MTLHSNIDARKYRQAYGRLEERRDDVRANPEIRKTAGEIVELVDTAYKVVVRVFGEDGYTVDGSDASEEFVGLILRFFLVSNPSFNGVVPAPESSPAASDEEDGDGDLDDKATQRWNSQ